MEEAKEQRDEKLVELDSVQGDFEAQVLKGMLESEGIEAAIRPGVAQNVLPFTVDGLGEMKIYVKEADLAAAKALIEEYREQE
ncbi:MAG: DUF2007 domain-containing protein [Candidatus Krumholzibacteria bacterium]|nr:DUF2007 domain-containing protein [Candidatus Krumholzibacteria bacterium]